jgi:hypothetical protein
MRYLIKEWYILKVNSISTIFMTNYYLQYKMEWGFLRGLKQTAEKLGYLYTREILFQYICIHVLHPIIKSASPIRNTVMCRAALWVGIWEGGR